MSYKNIIIGLFDANTFIQPRYEIGDLIGSGGFGQTYKAKKIGDPYPVAIKKIKLHHNNKKLFHKEVNVLKKMQTEYKNYNVLCLIDKPFIINDYGYIVTEYIDTSIDMIELLQDDDFNNSNFDVDQKRDLYIQLINGLEFIHGKGFIHMDIKPENIIVQPQDPARPGFARGVIIDFGMTVQIDDKTSNIYGTPRYASPELYDKSAAITSATDIFSMGIVFYLFSFFPECQFPFSTSEIEKWKLSSAYVKDFPSTLIIPNYSSNKHHTLSDFPFIISMLTICPEDRPSAKHLLSLINKPIRTDPELHNDNDAINQSDL